MTPNSLPNLPWRIVSKITIALSLSVPMLLCAEYHKTAYAQAALGNLGIPSASERFLEEGRKKFDREIQNLQDPLTSTEVLHIDEDVQSQNDLLRLEDPRFHSQETSPSAEFLSPLPQANDFIQQTSDQALHTGS